MIVLDVPPYKLIRIDAEHVDEALELVRPMLQLSVQHAAGFRSLDEMVESLRDGWRDWQLWLIVTSEATVGAFILTMERIGGELVATFELLAGVEAQSWIAPMIQHFEGYLAGMFGVTPTRVIGRRGWERWRARHGYEPSHFVTCKRLVRDCLPPAFADAHSSTRLAESGRSASSRAGMIGSPEPVLAENFPSGNVAH